MSASDRELLELAARAVGYELKEHYADGSVLIFDPSRSYAREWTPLSDDGDAFCLQVEMEFNVYHVGEIVFVEDMQYASKSVTQEPHGDDKFAATRRAIARASAEIGKAMP